MLLLVVDTQKLLINEELFSLEKFIDTIKTLISKARKNNVEVVYVMHDEGDDGELTKGKDGFEVYEEFMPMKNEQVFVKNLNSSFKNTGLVNYLKEKKQQDIVVVGLQTDKCIDATVKCGFEHGFNIIVPAYANGAINNDFMTAEESYRYYNEFMWKGRYAECISLEETIKRMENN